MRNLVVPSFISVLNISSIMVCTLYNVQIDLKAKKIGPTKANVGQTQLLSDLSGSDKIFSTVKQQGHRNREMPERAIFASQGWKTTSRDSIYL